MKSNVAQLPLSRADLWDLRRGLNARQITIRNDSAYSPRAAAVEILRVDTLIQKLSDFETLNATVPGWQ